MPPAARLSRAVRAADRPGGASIHWTAARSLPHPTMKIRIRPLPSLFALAALLACLAAATPSPVAQDPYRVVTTRPVVMLGWKANEEYRDDERLTRAFNQLAAEGFDPVFVQPVISTQEPVETRFVIVGRRR